MKEVQVADKVVMAVRDAEKLSDKLQNQVKRMLGKMGWTQCCRWMSCLVFDESFPVHIRDFANTVLPPFLHTHLHHSIMIPQSKLFHPGSASTSYIPTIGLLSVVAPNTAWLV